MQQRGFPSAVEQLIVGSWPEWGLESDPWPNDVAILLAVSRPVALAVRSGVLKDALRDWTEHLGELTKAEEGDVESSLVEMHDIFRCTNCLVEDTSQAFSAFSAENPQQGDS